MGKIIESKITQFNGGMVNDRRSTDTRYAAVVKHFDIKTRPHALVPYRSFEDGDSSSSTQKIVNIIPVGSTLYGLGVVSGTARVKVFTKTDLSNATWTTPGNGESASRTRQEDVFVYYRKVNKVFGLHGGDQAWSHTVGGAAFSETAQAIAYTNAAQGLVHSKDDVYYQPYDNKIATNNNDSWTAAALTLPSDIIITSIFEQGNYLGIACRSQQSAGKSRVYLWDRDSSVATLSENIDFGTGDLMVAEEMDGGILGISRLGSSSEIFNPKVIFRYWSGGSGARIIKEMECDVSGTFSLGIEKQKNNGTLYFSLTITQNGTQNLGVWAVCTSSDGLSVWLDRVSTAAPDNFLIHGNYAFIPSSSGATMEKSDDQANFTTTSAYESLIFNLGDSAIYKDLVRASVMFEPLPANGQVVFKYRVNAETSYTTLFTHTTDDAIAQSVVTDLPKHFREIQFRIESTGGAVITGFKFQAELIDKDL